MGLVDNSAYLNYCMSFYWAWQTLTSVGYGDFPKENPAEIWFTLFWMLIGVIFYSIIVGTLTSIFSSELTQ